MFPLRNDLGSENKQRVREVFTGEEDRSPPETEIMKVTPENILSHDGTKEESEKMLRWQETCMEEQIQEKSFANQVNEAIADNKISFADKAKMQEMFER